MWEDTIVSEVRKIRKEIETECGNDPDRIFERAVERQNKYIGKLVSPPQDIPKEIFHRIKRRTSI
jgi:hypothetical protein